MGSQSRRSLALTSGATVISTDLFPTADVAAGHTDWTQLDELKYVWLPGGTPVRCNPVSSSALADCSSRLLEDPQSLACAAQTTASMMVTTIATSTMNPSSTSKPLAALGTTTAS